MPKTTDEDRMKKLAERKTRIEQQEKALKLKQDYRKALDALKRKKG